MTLLRLLPLDLPAGHASSCEENVLLTASLHPTFAPNKDLLDSQPFIRFSGLATFPSCSCVYQITIVLRQWSQSLTKPKLASETLFTVVSPIYSPCSNRYTYRLQIIMFICTFPCFRNITWFLFSALLKMYETLFQRKIRYGNGCGWW